MIIEQLKAKDRASSVAFIGGPSYEERVAYAANDITDELIEGPPGSLAPGPERAEALSQSDPRAVMVVHGRNEAARLAMFDLLRALGLKPLEWGDLVSGTGRGAPYVGEVLEHAFQRARAVVVLFTPDDEARLRAPFRGPRVPDEEAQLTGQARPNVLFEAGMAFAVRPDRTVLVEIGEIRPFSDIGGRHVVRIDGTAKPLRDIARRLQAAGCEVDLSGDDWSYGGRFDAALELSATPAAPEGDAGRDRPASGPELEAIHDVLDELASIKLRVERAGREGGYAYNFNLPAHEYHEHKADLAGALREPLGRLYVKVDDLANRVATRENNGSEILEEDDLEGVLKLIEAAEEALRARRATLL